MTNRLARPVQFTNGGRRAVGAGAAELGKIGNFTGVILCSRRNFTHPPPAATARRPPLGWGRGEDAHLSVLGDSL